MNNKNQWIYKGNLSDFMLFDGVRNLNQLNANQSFVVCIRHKSGLLSIGATGNIMKFVKVWESRSRALGNKEIDIDYFYVSPPLQFDADYIKKSFKDILNDYQVNDSEFYNIDEVDLNKCFFYVYEKWYNIKNLYLTTMKENFEYTHTKSELVNEIKNLVEGDIPATKKIAKEVILNELEEIMGRKQFLEARFNEVNNLNEINNVV